MISAFFMNIIYEIVSGMFAVLPDISWSVETSAFTYFIDILRIAGYMLPMRTVSTISGLIVALTVFRIGISLIKTIWDLLPFA